MNRRAALRGALELALPAGHPVATLRAAVLPGEAGRAAFHEWATGTGDPRHLDPPATRAVRELGPLLDRVRRVHGRPVPDRALSTLLRAAGERERRRWASFATVAAELVEAEPAPRFVTGGLAVALRAYPEPDARHTHDVDLLGPTARTVEHSSGLPLAVHEGRLPPRWGQRDDRDVVQSRSTTDPPLGPEIRVAGVGDLLLVVLAHAAAGRPRHSVRWAADAAFLAAVAAPADWSVLVHDAVAAEIGPVVAVPLRFVATTLDGSVPAPVLDELEAGPIPTGARWDVALSWAHAGRARWPRLHDADERAGARALLRWGAWPSASYLASVPGGRSRTGRLAGWLRGGVRR